MSLIIVLQEYAVKEMQEKHNDRNVTVQVNVYNSHEPALQHMQTISNNQTLTHCDRSQKLALQYIQTEPNNHTLTHRDRSQEPALPHMQTELNIQTLIHHDRNQEPPLQNKQTVLNIQTLIQRDRSQEPALQHEQTEPKNQTPTQRDRSQEPALQHEQTEPKNQTPTQRDRSQEPALQHEQTEPKNQTPTQRDRSQESLLQHMQTEPNNQTLTQLDRSQEPALQHMQTEPNIQTLTHRDRSQEPAMQHMQTEPNNKTPTQRDRSRVSNRNLERFQRDLKTRYIGLSNGTGTWLGETPVELHENFVQVRLKSSRLNKAISHDEIFDSQRIMVVGRQGYGKSALCQQLAYLWATGEYHETQGLHSFKLVFYLAANDLRGFESISDAIMSLFVRNSTVDKVREILESNRVLFIVDSCPVAITDLPILQEPELQHMQTEPNIQTLTHHDRNQEPALQHMQTEPNNKTPTQRDRNQEPALQHMQTEPNIQTLTHHDRNQEPALQHMQTEPNNKTPTQRDRNQEPALQHMQTEPNIQTLTHHDRNQEPALQHMQTEPNIQTLTHHDRNQEPALQPMPTEPNNQTLTHCDRNQEPALQHMQTEPNIQTLTHRDRSQEPAMQHMQTEPNNKTPTQRDRSRVSNRNLERFQRDLKTRYIGLSNGTGTWLGETPVELHENFVQVRLKSSRLNKAISHDEIFDSQRIMVVGRQGYGKSALCQQLAYLWATGEYHETQGLHSFKLVFYLAANDLRGFESISDAIMSLFVRNSTVDKVREILESNRVLFIVDSCPVAITDLPILQGLLKRKFLKNAALLLTSDFAENIQEFVSFFDSHLTLERFTREQIIEYTEKFSDNNNLTLSKFVFDYCCNPLYLALLCHLSVIGNSWQFSTMRIEMCKDVLLIKLPNIDDRNMRYLEIDSHDMNGEDMKFFVHLLKLDKLVSLRLNGEMHTANLRQALTYSFSRMKSLTRLYIKNWGVQEQFALDEIFEATRPLQLQKFYLESIRLNRSNVRNLCRSMRGWESLRELVLVGLTFENSWFIDVADSLFSVCSRRPSSLIRDILNATQGCGKLEILHLKNLGIGDNLLLSLCELLTSLTTLKKLNIDADLQPEDVDQLTRCIKERPTSIKLNGNNLNA
ncbi:hypothetical protein CAPTEDRAFT_202591 [Capitella teleta]|uniref:NACHT domain-containing protein n=1 Tax=Capitella teleta TaxID=283909 RepID=R7VBU0_CAPTE|nr:hypothetical protein CAPTEDRAFT_202591 [Capitella teleta]|eukprot:ELU13150.1 hypothetical protein CAPTEDRAFT_202591 [Capitella teleta]